MAPESGEGRGRGARFGPLFHLARIIAPADFAIRHRPGARCAVWGRIPSAKVAAIRAFLAHDLRPDRPFTVRGRFGPGRAVRLRFDGRLGAGPRQRLRNFLIEHLR